MRIAISLLQLRPGRIGGAETYVRRLLRELPHVGGGDSLVAVMDRDLARGLETPGFERVVIDRSARAVVAERVLEAYTPFRARAIARAFERAGPDVALFPQQSIFPLEVDVPAVLTIHDLQHLFFPENFGLFDRTYRPRVYPPSMARARTLLAISEWTRQTVIERCGIAPEHIAAVPLGHERHDRSGVVPWDGAGGPYLYYPAATLPHKNHETLLRSYAALRRRGAIPHRLVLTGIVTPHLPALLRLARSLGVAGDVQHLGYLAYAEVARVYAGADAVVFPTRFEGFGLPAVEAVEFGRRVIVSRLPVFDEIGVPRAFQIDFSDPEQLRVALALPGPTVLEKATWTWADTARATLRALHAAAAGKHGVARDPDALACPR
jgi:glycosyltransferase involved in cell wall biosynthesis